MGMVTAEIVVVGPLVVNTSRGLFGRRVKYGLRWGPIGWMGDWLVTRRRIREMFVYRGWVLREILGASVNLG